jgi:geranylgeranyl diphosphate synthase, type II
MIIDFDLHLERQRERINGALERCLPEGRLPASLLEAMRYSITAGGKRLRPLLTLAAAEALGAGGGRIIDVACAVELVHTYSLIHDDLPVMDNSDLRRGKPTCHRVYGEAVAVLAGDALLTLAFELLARYGLEKGRARAALMISAELARAAGAEGMVGGQVLDLEAEGRVLDLAGLERIHRLKTGALIRAAVRGGALAGNAAPRELQALTEYGSRLGLAFQIIDDLLDQVGTTAELGKEAGADRDRAKATYPALLGRTEAQRRAEELYNEAVAFLNTLDIPSAHLKELARRLVFRKK